MTIKEKIAIAKEIQELCEKRAEPKMSAKGKPEFDSFESMSFEGNAETGELQIYVLLRDSHYDLYDAESIELTSDELDMSDEEFENHLAKYKHEQKLLREKIKAQKEKEDEREKINFEKKQLEHLKKKYEG